MKVCTQCKCEKKKEEFPKRKTNKDGLYSWCKECCIKKTKEYAKANPWSIKISREKGKQRALEAARKYKEKHKLRLAQRQKAYYEINKEKLKAKAREYGKNPSEEVKKRKKEYYQKWKNTEAAKRYRKEKLPEIRKKYEKHRKASSKVTDAVRSGKLIKPDNCTLCLSKENIEGHHPDYDKPLEVIWLCRKCHRAIHKSMKERGKK